MPVTMGGVASGMDTDSIIEKLVNVEAQPIKQMQRDIALNRGKKSALQTLSSTLKDLDKATRDLYGFRSAYDEKKVTSSDQTVLTANATKAAEKGFREIEVMEIASTHKISTDEIDEKENIASGKFTLKVEDDSYTVRFKGGTLKALQQRIDEAAGSHLSTSLVRRDDHIGRSGTSEEHRTCDRDEGRR
jgi:flagellar hook-associated protein 2